MFRLIEIAELAKLSLTELLCYNTDLTRETKFLEKYLRDPNETYIDNNNDLSKYIPNYKKDFPFTDLLKQMGDIIHNKLDEQRILDDIEQAKQLKCYLPKYIEYLNSKFLVPPQKIVI